MSAPRFYCPVSLPESGSFELPPDAAHHAKQVLRLRVGDAVQVFDGAGHACNATVGEISGKQVVLHNLRACPPDAAFGLHIVLAQAMSSSEKMDWVVQKATELGAAEIQPVQTQRSVARLTAERAEKRTEHWRGVIVSACEQCGRNTLPQVHAPQDFSGWLGHARALPGSKLILLPDGAAALHAQAQPQGTVTLLIGPEGGFSADEGAKLRTMPQVHPLSLGPRILRADTAAAAAITLWQARHGDWR